MSSSVVVKILASSAAVVLMAATLTGCSAINGGSQEPESPTSTVAVADPPPEPEVVTTPLTPEPTPVPTTWAETNDLIATGIVKISSTKCDGTLWTGTGFQIGRNLIVTAEHVVAGKNSLELSSAGATGLLTSKASVLGRDPDLDVALLRADATLGGHVFKLSAQVPRIGDEVAVAGFPFGFSYALNPGLVNSVGHAGDGGLDYAQNKIQTGAQINGGNSGGPLVSKAGDVLGIVVSSLNEDYVDNKVEGIGYALQAAIAIPKINGWKAASTVDPLETCSTPTPAPTMESKTSFPIDNQSTHISSQEIARLLLWHGPSINKSDYWSAFGDFTAKQQKDMGGFQEWAKGQQTSVWQSIVLESVTGTGETLQALAAIRTYQDADFGYEGQTCSDFKINYTIVFVDGRWMIDSAPAADGFKVPQAC